MNGAGIGDPSEIEAVRALGVVDLPTLQKKMNLHFSLSLDLFGSEVSTNAANFFTAGLKGRYQENRLTDDHRLVNATYPVLKRAEDGIALIDEPALTALNMRLRDDYVEDCERGIERWNRIIAEDGIDFRLRLPHVAFHRQIGEFRSSRVSPEGELLDEATWARSRDAWLPSAEDGEFIASLMQPETKPGQFARWIAPPRVGIDNRPGDFEYVQIAG
jgi:benzoyl-CoA 2,3-dioxygenase component B